MNILLILAPIIVLYIITQLIWPLIDREGFFFNWLFQYKRWHKYRADVKNYKEFIKQREDFFHRVVEITRKTAHQ